MKTSYPTPFKTTLPQSGFKTRVRSTFSASNQCRCQRPKRRRGRATLKPDIAKVFQVGGRLGKLFETRALGRMRNRVPSFCINCAALAGFNGVIHPFTRERKYQTRLGS